MLVVRGLFRFFVFLPSSNSDQHPRKPELTAEAERSCLVAGIVPIVFVISQASPVTGAMYTARRKQVCNLKGLTFRVYYMQVQNSTKNDFHPSSEEHLVGSLTSTAGVNALNLLTHHPGDCFSLTPLLTRALTLTLAATLVSASTPASPREGGPAEKLKVAFLLA